MIAPLLAIPPFPGARAPVFAQRGHRSPVDIDDTLAALAEHRVGGNYWGNWPDLPDGPLVIDGTPAPPEDGALAWPPSADPWHLLARAERVRLPAGDPRLVLAIAADVEVVEAGTESRPGRAAIEMLVRRHLSDWQWRDPFSGVAMDIRAAIALCGFWRRLIDANRPIIAAMGFAGWKRPTAAPLLWGGSPVRFCNKLPVLGQGEKVAIWRARLSGPQARALATAEARVVEVEDGFIRSAGLGADCVPPLSLVVDGLGVHFDPTQPSELERTIEQADFSAACLARARALREAIVAAGLSKYERAKQPAMARPGGRRWHVLVPGQVEDDRALTSGGALPSNLELLRRARALAGREAYLIYKPHPDVLAGHRRGHVPATEVAALADQVETAAPMATLIDMVDALHVNSSLAGFEALLRGKTVHVHGAPFYAGWGLTVDHGEVPARRTARRSIDELVAAALLMYPRYLDPETGLPCPAEVLVERLGGRPPRLGSAAAALVSGRRVLGRARLMLGRLGK